MEEDARAPAERDPIEPPRAGRHGEIDQEKDQHRRHIGEEVHGEAPRLPVDEDALSPPRLAQEERKGVGGDCGAPAERHPAEPERAGGEPEIDRGANESAGEEGREVQYKDAHRQVFEHAPRPFAVRAVSRGYLSRDLSALIENTIFNSWFRRSCSNVR